MSTPPEWGRSPLRSRRPCPQPARWIAGTRRNAACHFSLSPPAEMSALLSLAPVPLIPQGLSVRAPVFGWGSSVYSSSLLLLGGFWRRSPRTLTRNAADASAEDFR